jgi:hypothetical protein
LFSVLLVLISLCELIHPSLKRKQLLSRGNEPFPILQLASCSLGCSKTLTTFAPWLSFHLQICSLVGTFFHQTRYKPSCDFLIYVHLLITIPCDYLLAPWPPFLKRVSQSLPKYPFMFLGGSPIQHLLIHPVSSMKVN